MGNKVSSKLVESLEPIQRGEYLTHGMMKIYEKKLDILIPSSVKLVCFRFVGELLIEHPAVTKPAKFSHKELLQRKIIIEVDQIIINPTKANPENLVYQFTQTSRNEYELEVQYKVGFGSSISPFPEPFTLNMDNLKEKYNNGETKFSVEFMIMSIERLLTWLPTLKCNLIPLKY